MLCAAPDVCAVTVPIVIEVNSNVDNKPFFDPDFMTFADPLNKNPDGYSGTAQPGVSTSSSVSGPSIEVFGTSRLADLSDGNGVPYGVTVLLTDLSFQVDALNGVLTAAGTDGNDGLGINSTSTENADSSTSQLGGGSTVSEQVRFDNLQVTSSTISDPLGRLAGASISAPYWRVLRSNQFAEATESAKISSDAGGTTDVLTFGVGGTGSINNNFGTGTTASTTFNMPSPMFVTTTVGNWGLKGVGVGVDADLTIVADPNHRIYDFSNAGTNGEPTRTVTENGLDLTLTPSGESASLGYNNQGAGVLSFGDPDGIGSDPDLRIEGATGAGSAGGFRNTPEVLQLSFSQDVYFESLFLGNVSGTGTEPVILSFLSGDNPFDGLSGYTTDGFSTDGNSVTYTLAETGGTLFIPYGSDGRDQILVTAGTVLGLTTNPSIEGGALLRMLSATIVTEDGLTGDFNDDNIVDAADYVLWRKLNTTSNELPNDGDLGMPIRDDHYNLWREHFGESLSGGGTAGVPEPSSIVLLMAAVSLVGGGRSRRVRTSRGFKTGD
jgi:hypothetical protein